MQAIIPTPIQINREFSLTPGISKILSVFYKIHRYWRWQKYYRDVYGNNGENLPLTIASHTMDWVIGKQTLMGRLYTGVGWTLLVSRCVLNTLQAYGQLSRNCAIFKEHWSGPNALGTRIYSAPKTIEFLFGKAMATQMINHIVYLSIRIYHLTKMLFVIIYCLFTVSQHLIELGEALLVEKEIRQEARQMILINLRSVLETIKNNKENLLNQIENNRETICSFIHKVGIPGFTPEMVIDLTKKGIEKTEQTQHFLKSSPVKILHFIGGNINHLAKNLFDSSPLIPLPFLTQSIVPIKIKQTPVDRQMNIDLNNI